MLAIKNLSSHQTFTVDPWTLTDKMNKDAFPTKAAFLEWCVRPTTENCHYTMFEGMDAGRRIDSSNAPLKVYGFIADFDAKTSKDVMLALKDQCPSELVPNKASLTFSHGGRLIWFLSEPVLLANIEVTKEMLKIAAKKLKLTKCLAGFDADAFIDPSKYYELGREWYDIQPEPIPVAIVHSWMAEAGSKVEWDLEKFQVPLAAVQEAINVKYPNAWPGPFEEGTRGPRFWDSTATNPTSAVLRASGFQCFSGDRPFVTWRDLLGSKFVDQYKATTIGSIIANYYYDGEKFWGKHVYGYWEPIGKEDLKLRLRAQYKLKSSIKKGEAVSEVEEVIYSIQSQKTVVAALPFLHQPEGPRLGDDGMLYLNIANAHCAKPAEENINLWGQGFPWLADYLGSLFVTDEQLSHFLSWWKLFYMGALDWKPRSGQAIFVVGPTGVGKSLLLEVVSKSVGGHADASSFVLGQERFTSHILNAPVMSVDDTGPASDHRKHTLYSAMIKKLVANRKLTYERKFVQSGQVVWLGRVIVACNDDPESIRLLPSVDISMLDKVCFYRCRNREFPFPDAEKIEKIIAAEIPYLCKYLINYAIPPEYRGEARFGIKAFHDGFLLSGATQSSGCMAFLELLEEFLSDYTEFKREDIYEGTATQLHLDMCKSARVGSLVGRFTVHQLAIWLGQLEAKGFNIKNVRDRHRRFWEIPKNMESPADAPPPKPTRRRAEREDDNAENAEAAEGDGAELRDSGEMEPVREG